MGKIGGKKYVFVVIVAAIFFLISTFIWNQKRRIDQRIIIENSSSFRMKVTTAKNNRNSLVLNDSIIFYKCRNEEVLLKSSTLFINEKSQEKIKGYLISAPYILKKEKGSDLLIVTSNRGDSLFCKLCD
tara:strand:+ start:212 stop:598 length:387 start_codon:yes stop_codon:yes gene_type:complete